MEGYSCPILALCGTIAAIWMQGVLSRTSDGKIAVANKIAQEARERTQLLERDTAKLQKEAAEANLALEQLKQKIAPRKMTDEQENYWNLH